MTSFNGKIVLITGGASGIGKIMVRLMLERKAKVIIWDIHQEGIDRTIAEFSGKGKVFGYKVDVSSLEQIQETAKKVKAEIGVVDILINNAGIVVGKYFNEHTPSDISKTIDINTNAPMFITREFLDDMLKQNSGHICNIASSGGLVSNPKMSVYAASKWAVVGMTKTLAMELGKYKIRVNAICPGTIKGDRMKRVIRDKAKFTKVSVKKIESDFISMASMKSWINEEDIGNMCAYLISDEANKISGQVIAVDGNAERMD